MIRGRQHYLGLAASIAVLVVTGCSTDSDRGDPLAPNVASFKPPPGHGGGGEPREIAFYSSRGKGGSIRAIAADGSNAETIVRVDDFLIRISWNRAGTMLAYEEDDAIYRINADGTGKTLLLSAADCGVSGCWRPAWSPSSTQDEVAVLNWASGGDIPKVFLVPAGGGAPVVFYSGDPGWTFDDLAWSPDGSQLAVSTTFDEIPVREDRLVIVQRSDGTAADELSYVGMGAIDWSRQDGDLIAMDVVDVAGGTTGRDVYIYDLRTETLSFARALARDPSFSPDNSYFAYTSMEGGGIYKHDLTSGSVTQLSREGLYADWKR